MARRAWAVDDMREIPFEIDPEDRWSDYFDEDPDPELAPEGARDHQGTHWLGKHVVFDTVLARYSSSNDKGNKEFRGWARVKLAEKVHGHICGARTVQSGEYNEGSYTSDSIFGPEVVQDPYLAPTRTHRVFVVAWDLFRRPVLVLSDDVKSPPLTFERVELCEACGQTLPPDHEEE